MSLSAARFLMAREAGSMPAETPVSLLDIGNLFIPLRAFYTWRTAEESQHAATQERASTLVSSRDGEDRKTVIMNASRSGFQPSLQVWVRNGSLENPRKFYNQDFNSLRDCHLKKGTLFVDDAFPANLNSIGSGKDLDINTRKIETHGKKPHLVVEGTSLFDILQSKRLGDCWFLCAMGALTLKPNLLKNVMPGNQEYDANYAGIFHFRLWHLGEWVDIVIDDMLPFLNGEFLYVQPSSANEFWPCLLEKAYAKLLGSYQNLHWGFPEEAFVNLTGGITMTFDLKSVQLQRNYFWQMISKASPDTVMACVNGKQKEALDFRRASVPITHIAENPVLINGLVQSHAYCITDTTQVEMKDGFVKLIRLWNPWGQGEWRGAWNDKSPTWTELREEDRQRLRRVRDDGEFWMSWEDFSLEFSIIILCNHTPDFLDWGGQHRRWYKKMFWNRWTKDELFSRNPQYMITVTSSDEVNKGYNAVILLMQSSRNRQKFEGQWLPIGFKLFKVGSQFQDTREPLPASFFNRERLTKLEVCRQRDTTMSYGLAAGKYVVVPYTMEKEKEASFLLQIFLKSKDCAIELSPVEKMKEHETHPYEGVFKRYATKGAIRNSWVLQKCLNEVFIKDFPYANGVKFTIESSRGLLASMDVSFTGKLELDNFSSLWRYLTQFKDIFADIDSNRCGYLNSAELRKAVNRAGLNVSKDLFNLIIARYGDSEDKLNFVDYLLCMARLKAAAKTFMKLSDDGNEVCINQEKWMELMV
ncbi:PREDICTED: calpain-13-like [Nanorana parkeri]|uniref:calpain-13-like n=1 Tax=Nanorana parkeri TaxID=125878 RepID=UPI0008540B48|nr:PREDICTED: calpain-13-like [Nanorana parkeri]